MSLLPFTASADFTARGRRLASWHVSQGAGAQTINFRNGGLAGTIQFQIQLATTTSASQAYSTPELPVFSSGLYVEIVGTGFAQGCVDLV